MTEREAAVIQLIRQTINKAAASLMLEMGVEPEAVATHLDRWIDEDHKA